MKDIKKLIATLIVSVLWIIACYLIMFYTGSFKAVDCGQYYKSDRDSCYFDSEKYEKDPEASAEMGDLVLTSFPHSSAKTKFNPVNRTNEIIIPLATIAYVGSLFIIWHKTKLKT
ncbi:MAG: hypothetical protein WCP03_03740 [Candidatus Saccharibacteria bacterium]